MIILFNIISGGKDLLGYVRAYKPDMKMRDYEFYRGIYCSLCRALGRNYSPLAQLFLSYDFALACVIRLACAESGCSFSAKRCPYNPAKKCLICGSKDIFDFCSHAVIITVYYKILDNLHDKGFFKKLGAALILPAVALMHRKAKRLAPEAEKAVADAMKLQAETEAKPSPSIDEAAHPSAEALGKIFTIGASESQKDSLRTIGYLTGRFVYILDAADDLDDDLKKGAFNPFSGCDISSPEKQKEFADKIRGMLNLTQNGILEALDSLEIKRFYDISENILLDGITACAEKVLGKYEDKPEKKNTFVVE
ncbi:MAG: hypothetical protein J6R20_02355 [Clostridia bacterium]|nr:hypothetical protein [Clostridia bacterium]